MARSNVIIVGSVVLAPLILGVESYALFRSHHRRAAIRETRASTETGAAPAVSIARSAAVPVPVARPSAPLAPEAPAAEALPPGTETVSDVQPDPRAARRRQLMLERRGEILQAADEQVFDLLHSPEAQRAAIRAIDGAYAQSAGLDPNADQTRRAAIADVLGPDATDAFNFADRKAERQVRNQHRPEQVGGR